MKVETECVIIITNADHCEFSLRCQQPPGRGQGVETFPVPVPELSHPDPSFPDVWSLANSSHRFSDIRPWRGYGYERPGSCPGYNWIQDTPSSSHTLQHCTLHILQPGIWKTSLHFLANIFAPSIKSFCTRKFLKLFVASMQLPSRSHKDRDFCQ